MNIVEVRNTWGKVAFWLRRMRCRILGHKWTDWEPVKFGLTEAKHRHCKRCGLNNVDRNIPLQSIISETLKRRREMLKTAFREEDPRAEILRQVTEYSLEKGVINAD